MWEEQSEYRLILLIIRRLTIHRFFWVVLESNERFYRIGTKNGILQQKLTKNQFEPANNNFITAEEVPNVETSFRAAVGAESLTGSKGYKYCTNGYVNGRCACRKTNILGNS